LVPSERKRSQRHSEGFDTLLSGYLPRRHVGRRQAVGRHFGRYARDSAKPRSYFGDIRAISGGPLVLKLATAHANRWKVMAMDDRELANNWHVDIEFSEDDVHTHASARAQLRDGETVTTTGDAYRNPKDTSEPMIGEEIAAARALIALGTELLHAASMRIEQATHHPVHLYR
jgi:Domain of unknown function (DUF1876)